MELTNDFPSPFLSLENNDLYFFACLIFLLQVLVVRSGVYEQLNQMIFSKLVLALPVRSKLILTKTSRPSRCSISWIVAII